MGKATVKLSDIIIGIESQSYEMMSFLNVKTGDVVSITDEELQAAEEDEPIENYPDWQRDSILTAIEIIEGDDYYALPSQFDLHEYEIMEKFSLSIKDKNISDVLYYSIKGKGAFRRFKDNVYKYNIENEWYEFRDRRIKEFAIEWCMSKGIDFIEE